MRVAVFAAQVVYIAGASYLSTAAVEKLDKLAKEQAENEAKSDVSAEDGAKVEQEQKLPEAKSEGKVKQRGKAKKKKKKQLEEEKEKERKAKEMTEQADAEEAAKRKEKERQAQEETATGVVLRVVALYCLGACLLVLLLLAHIPKSLYSTYSLPFYASPIYIRQTLQRVTKNKMYSADERAAAEQAYKILMIKENRELYDRFGVVLTEGDSEDTMLQDYGISLATYIFSWLLVSFIVSDSKKGRGKVFGLSIFVLAAIAMYDATTRWLQWFHPCYHLVGIPVLGSMTVHEVLECLKESGFPLFLSCAIFHADYSFVDILPYLQYTLELAQASQQDVDESCDRLLQTVKDRQALNAQRTSEGKPSESSEQSKGNVSSEKPTVEPPTGH